MLWRALLLTIFVLWLKCLHLGLVFDPPLLLVCLAPKLGEVGMTGHLCLLHYDYGTLCPQIALNGWICVQYKCSYCYHYHYYYYYYSYLHRIQKELPLKISYTACTSGMYMYMYLILHMNIFFWHGPSHQTEHFRRKDNPIQSKMASCQLDQWK